MTDLLGAKEIRELCRTLEIKPTKKRGQNFVNDPGTVRKIAAEAGIIPGDVVLEIGPGLGSLTLALLERGAKVAALEIDSRLARALDATVEAHQAPTQNLRVICTDALTVSSAELAKTTQWPVPQILVANLPYNLATALLLHSLEAIPQLERAVVMVQAEVANRLVAKMGDESYGAPSVKLAWWGQAKRSFKVSRQIFFPIPNVDSTVVEFQRRPPTFPPAQHLNPTQLESLRLRTFEYVNAAFGMRRKTLRQSLAKLCTTPETARQLLEAVGINPGLRAENLTINDFVQIAATELFGMDGTV